MPPAGFEPAIPASKLLQTHSLDSAATGIGRGLPYKDKYDNWLLVGSSFMMLVPCIIISHLLCLSHIRHGHSLVTLGWLPQN